MDKQTLDLFNQIPPRFHKRIQKVHLTASICRVQVGGGVCVVGFLRTHLTREELVALDCDSQLRAVEASKGYIGVVLGV